MELFHIFSNPARNDTIRDVLGEDLGDFSSMARLFASVMQIAKRRHFTLVFDEFQNFKYVNESFFSEMQNIWDSNKNVAHINLVVCGSLYSMMTKIFDDKKEPLYASMSQSLSLCRRISYYSNGCYCNRCCKDNDFILIEQTFSYQGFQSVRRMGLRCICPANILSAHSHGAYTLQEKTSRPKCPC